MTPVIAAFFILLPPLFFMVSSLQPFSRRLLPFTTSSLAALTTAWLIYKEQKKLPHVPPPPPKDLHHHQWKEIKTGWNDDVHDELARLRREEPLLFSETEKLEELQEEQRQKHLKKALKRKKKPEPVFEKTFSLTPEHKVMLIHAGQFLRLHRDTHFVFFHGQNCGYWFLNQVYKELSKCMHPKKDVRFTQVLRSPHQKLLSSMESYHSLLEDCFEHLALLCGYSRSSGPISGLDHHPDLRKHALSTSLNLFDCQYTESANDMVWRNQSVHNDWWKRLLELQTESGCLQEFPFLAPLLSTDLRHPISQLNNSSTGVLYAIAIPKEPASTEPFNPSQPPPSDSFYLSLPYGYRYTKCSSHEELKEILKILQEPKVPPPSLPDQGKETDPKLQARVLCSALSHPDTHAVALTPYPPETKNTLKDKARQVAKLFHWGWLRKETPTKALSPSRFSLDSFT